MAEIVVNQYKLNNPIVGTVVSNRRLTSERHGLDQDVRHIVIQYKEKYPYVPGQSAGVVPPGIDSRTGKPNQLRLYSVASERRGDDGSGQSVSLCVVRHFFDDAAKGKKHVAGVCSNYLCDLKPGDQVKMTGPAGKHFVLPDDFKSRDIIFAATGTGIAPYRGMLKEMFDAGFSGRVWLYFGIPYKDAILYDDEFKNFASKHKNFSYLTAISREDTNPIPDKIPTRSNKMYVQVRMYQDKDVLEEAFSKRNALLYLCGLKGMEDGIFPVLDGIGKELGFVKPYSQVLKEEKRLLVEVY